MFGALIVSVTSMVMNRLLGPPKPPAPPSRPAKRDDVIDI
jgi:putative membrane protein